MDEQLMRRVVAGCEGTTTPGDMLGDHYPQLLLLHVGEKMLGSHPVAAVAGVGDGAGVATVD